MQEKQFKVVVGGLLHDVGKLLYRYNDGRNHSTSGYEFLKDESKLQDDEILNQVRYHHSLAISGANIPDNSLAYITYIADNISSASDRRKTNEDGTGFVRDIAIDSIFNMLNGNIEKLKYQPQFLGEDINYPQDKQIKYSEQFYGEVVRNIKENVGAIEFTPRYINSLLEILEANLTYIPSSTNVGEVADISLYDHCKFTAALGSCILQYLQENNIENYKEALYKNAKSFYGKPAFLLYSIDISGIQNFIYTITSDGALKALRSRSLYLELLMEHIVDSILNALSLSRANLVYCGGGHAYMLLANTENTISDISRIEKEINEWFLQTFGTELYIAGGYCPCSANDIKNEPEGSYSNIFKTISNNISATKMNRYSALQIIALNNKQNETALRECRVCHRRDKLSINDKCSICEGLEKFSKMAQQTQFFTVINTVIENALPLPFNNYLISDTKEKLIERIKQNKEYVRSYCKNTQYTGADVTSKIWMGDYQNGNDFHDFVSESTGIKRIAAMRADIDNLGKAFVSGFNEKYATLSRTSTFSRKLSLFFKLHINKILKEGCYYLTDDNDTSRKATIVYSGGDDVFIIGEWSDIIGFAVDLSEEVERYTQGSLTLSAGIGIYPEKYPVSAMARQTGQLEETAKANPGKNSVSIFSEENTYSWDEFINEVLEDKYQLIKEFFNSSNKYGKNFLYNLLDLMRNRKQTINIARYAYFLSRMQPAEDAPEQDKTLYKEFSQKMYSWMQDEKQCKQAITAIYIYAYTIREQQED